MQRALAAATRMLDRQAAPSRPASRRRVALEQAEATPPTPGPISPAAPATTTDHHRLTLRAPVTGLVTT